MIISNNSEPNRKEFDFLLGSTLTELNSHAKNSSKKVATLLGRNLEPFVKKYFELLHKIEQNGISGMEIEYLNIEIKINDLRIREAMITQEVMEEKIKKMKTKIIQLNAEIKELKN